MTIPIVILIFPVTFLLVQVGVAALNNATRDASGSTVAPDHEARSAIPSGTANLLGVVIAFGATATLAKEAWGRRGTTEAWRIGAEGEERTARHLDRLEGMGFRVLHDCRVPGHRSNIDHVVIGPTGVFTVETKNYAGKVGIRKPLFAREPVVMHNGRRLDTVVDQALRQADIVGGIVDAALFNRGVRVQPIVAIHRAKLERSWFLQPMTRGVRWCSAGRLSRVLKSGRHVLSREEITTAADALDRNLLSGSGPEAKQIAAVGEGASVSAERLAPMCRCGAPVVLRHRKSDGNAFFGCSTFPKCRQTMPV